MIRKILMIFAVLFLSVWFGVAYLLKVRTAHLIENLKVNNLEFSYERISVTGFPSVWQVKITKPKLKLAGNSDHKEISTKDIDCIFDLSFKKAKLIVNDKIMQEEDFGQQKNYYYLNSEQPISCFLKFTKPFYKLNKNSNVANIIKTFNLKNVNLSASFQDEKIFDISDLTLSLKKGEFDGQQNVGLKIQGNYHGQNYLLGFNSAYLNLDSTLMSKSDPASADVVDHTTYKINSFELNIDEDSKFNMVGTLGTYDGKFEQGQFFISVSNYSKLIDKLVHPNFIIPKSTLKQIIADEGIVVELNKDSCDTQTAFEIKLSKSTIMIGSTNLFDIAKDDVEINSEAER